MTMPYTAGELITRAYYLSGVVSRDFQSVSGGQKTDGLNLLNEALAEEAMTGELIPYYKEYSLNAIAGQEKYFIPNLIQVDTFTFNIGTVRYPTEVQQRRKYFGRGRSDNIQSLPFTYHIERVLGGSDLYIYFLPKEAYPLKIWGKFAFDDIATTCEDLSLIFDKYFIKYLTYTLAEDICEENQIPFPPEAQKKLSSLGEQLTYISPPDLTTKKYSSLGGRETVNYAYANLGTGWWPC